MEVKRRRSSTTAPSSSSSSYLLREPGGTSTKTTTSPTTETLNGAERPSDFLQIAGYFEPVLTKGGVCMRIPTELPARSSRRGELESRPLGHAHFWERAMETTFSRGQFLRRGAVAAGGFAGLSVLAPGLARAAGSDPRPIPGGIQPFGPGTEVFHVFLPEHGSEPSTIFDFKGFVGVAHLQGTGTGTDTSTGNTTPLVFDVDNRFMKGVYVGVDGKKHH